MLRAAFEIEGGGLDALHVLVAVSAEDFFRHRDTLALEIGIGAASRLWKRHGRDLRSADVVAYRHVHLIRHDDLGEAGTTGLQHLDAPFLMIVHQIAVALHGVVDVGETAEHDGIGFGVRLVDGHLQLLLSGLAKLQVYVALGTHGETGRCHNDEGEESFFHIDDLFVYSLQFTVYR